MLFLLRDPLTLAAVAVALLVGTVLHGYVQTRVAAALGDRMAQATGRASLDPRRHLDVFGVIAMLLTNLGWGKPVPLQEPRFRAARPRFALAVLSGPLTHLVLAFLAIVGLRLFDADAVVGESGFGTDGPGFGTILLRVMMVINAALAVLTLVPLPPLDGARLLWAFTPATEGWRKARYYLEEQNVGIGICLLLILPLFGDPGLLKRLALDIGGVIVEQLGRLIGLSIR